MIDLAIHVLVAWAVQLIAGAILVGAYAVLCMFGLDAFLWRPGVIVGAWGGALAGAATFYSRELAQGPYKAALKGDKNWAGHVNWTEAHVPAAGCVVAAIGVGFAIWPP